jgi:hypothetical protein
VSDTRDIMPGCWKVPYPTESAAKRELKRFQRAKYRGGQAPQRVYQCPDCKEWHLTSQGAKPWWKR